MADYPTVANITLDEILHHAVDGIFVLDTDRRVVHFSPGCERITGRNAASVVGTSCACHEIHACRDEHGRSLSGFLCPSGHIFDGIRTSARQRMSVRRGDGQRAWVENTYSPVKDESGRVKAIVGIMRDITEVMEREEELREAVSGRLAGADVEAFPAAPASPGLDDPTGNGGGGRLDRILATLERKEILASLQQAQGQRTQAARLLGISRSRLYRRMEALGIDPRQAGSRDTA